MDRVGYGWDGGLGGGWGSKIGLFFGGIGIDFSNKYPFCSMLPDLQNNVAEFATFVKTMHDFGEFSKKLIIVLQDFSVCNFTNISSHFG